MATKPSWVTLSKTSGSGDDSFNVSASEHTGRVKRSGTITVTGDNAAAKTFTIEQSPKTEFISLNKNAFTVDKAGGTVTISITSNATGVKFELVDDVDNTTSTSSVQCWFIVTEGSGASAVTVNRRTYNSETTQTITLPTQWSPAGKTTNNGSAISTDPGATAEYSGSISLTFAENDASLPQYIRFKATTLTTGATVNATIVQSASSAFLNLYTDAEHTTEATTVTLDQAGTAQTIYVDSNDSWTVS